MSGNNYALLECITETDKHSVIVGMTGSGKTIFSNWFVKQKARCKIPVLYLSAKQESPDFYERFDLSTVDIKEALLSLVDEEIGTIALRIEYMDGGSLLDIFNSIEQFAIHNLEEEIYFPICVCVDEVSLLVRHKMEGSPATLALGRAAAIWRGFNLQLITMSQRTATIPQTVLTQANSIILFHFKQADIKSLSTTIGINVENDFEWLSANPFHFVEYIGNESTRFNPIPFGEIT